MDGTAGTPRIAAGMALAALLALLLVGCGGGDDTVWVNPDVGSAAEPQGVEATQLPYTGEVTEGIHYLVVRGLPANTPHYVALMGKSADADLFVLGDPSFADYACSSVRGGAADDECSTAPLAGDALYVQVYGYTGNDTRFILDIW